MLYNFSAGPAMLPSEVLNVASKALINYNNTGLSISEIGHRSNLFKEILSEAKQYVKLLLSISDDYEVLFLSGGANMQFLMTPINYLDKNETAAYIDTGKWAQRAIKEAQLYGNVSIVGSSVDKAYNYIPKILTKGDYKYLYITTNNTIRGTQYKVLPDLDCPIIGDMSSDIFSRKIDINRFDLVFACAQKNLGIAGTTLVIVKKDSIGKVRRQIPTILNYNTHIEAESIYNTPPVFPIYVSMLTLKWLHDNGGVSVFEDKNNLKAELIYNEIDRNQLFNNYVNTEDRSNMNAVFSISDSKLEENFFKYASDNGCVGIRGHRSIGGFRVSMYNAMPLEGVQQLIQIMQEFEKNH